MFKIWGLVTLLSVPLAPVEQIGPYATMDECYKMLSIRLVQLEGLDSRYRGECEKFPKMGKAITADPNAQWMTSAQLAAKAK